MPVLKLENLSKYYVSQSSVVMGLSNINLSFETGEFVAVTGESGSGKSTLAQLLGGILPYESGELYVYGKPTSHYDVSDWERYRRDMIGFVSQNYGILAGNTVFENVESALLFSGLDKKEAAKRADEILEEVELSDLKTRRANKLSSGQKQRLSIARALAKPSKILIADEPTGNLDRENSENVVKLLKKASRDRLVIIITHEFDEVKDLTTRRIVLADGAVVTDTKISETAVPEEITSEREESKKGSPRLVPYVASLTLRSRPAFSAIVCLLLAFTSFITFVFLGTFIVALDESSVKLYSSDVFFNGDRDRIVVMKDDGSAFKEEDYYSILNMPYVTDLERWGYVNDVNYYYRPEVDYHSFTEIVNGENYHPLLNPDDYQVTEVVKFYDTELYMRTLPVDGEADILTGRAPEGVYEVVSADPSFKAGDKVKVYIRNLESWSASAYIPLTFTVVGETDRGQGLYFSDIFAAAISRTTNYVSEERTVRLMTKAFVLPYTPENFDILYSWEETESGASTAVEVTDDTAFVLEENEVCLSEFLAKTIKRKLGGTAVFTVGESSFPVVLKGFYDPGHTRLVAVNPVMFEKLVDTVPDNQVSVYIKDYAYADRVMERLGQEGYISASPFKLGSSKTDSRLASERTTTLWVCLGALILVAALQVILLKAMFSSLNDHFLLMSNVGLTAGPAYSALGLLLLLFTVVGEALGATAVVALNSLEVERVAAIFKYMETESIVVLFAVHFAVACLAFAPVILSVKNAVYPRSKRQRDIDFSELEEV